MLRRALNRDPPGGPVIDVGHRCCGQCTRHRLFGVKLVNIAGHDRDGLAHLVLGQGVGGLLCALDLQAIGQPLVVDFAHAVEVRQRVGRRQGFTLGGGAADQHFTGGFIVDVGHGFSGVALDDLIFAKAVGVGSPHREGLAHIALAQDVGRGGLAHDSDAISQPLVAHRAQAVEVCQEGEVGLQGLALLGQAVDHDAAGWVIVHIDHSGGGFTDDEFFGARPIGVTGDHRDCLVYLSLREYEAVRGSACDSHTSGTPLVVDSARGNAIQVGQRIANGELLTLSGNAVDFDTAGHRVVDVDDGSRCFAFNRLRCPKTIGVTGNNADRLAHLGLRELVSRQIGAGNVFIVCAPLVAHGALTVKVHQGVAGREGLVLGGGAADGHRAGSHIVDVGHRGAGAAGHGLFEAKGVGVAGFNTYRLVDIALQELVAVRGGTANGLTVGQPLVAYLTNRAVDICERVGGGEGLVLGGRAVYGHLASGKVVHISNRRGGHAGFGFLGAKSVRETGGYGDLFVDLVLGHGVERCSRPLNGLTVGLPLVAHRVLVHAVNVCHRVPCREGLALGGFARDGDRAGGGVVDVGHRRGGPTGEGLFCAKAVFVAGIERDGLVDVGLRQFVGGQVGPLDSHPVGEPLVANSAQAVGISQRVVRAQGLPLRGAATDAQVAGAKVVDVGDGGACAAGLGLQRTKTIGVAGVDGDSFTNLCLRQRVGGISRPGNRRAIGQPLVFDRARGNAVQVDQVVDRGQGLVLRGRTRNLHRATDGVVHIGYGRCGAAGDGIFATLGIGITGRHRHGFTHLGLRELVGGCSRPVNGNAVSVPLVAQGAHAIGIF